MAWAHRRARRTRHLALLPACAWACFALTATAADKQLPAPPALSLERIHAEPPLQGRALGAGQLSPGGRWLTSLRPAAGQPDVNELWGQALPGGQPRRLLQVSDLIGNQAATLTEAERMALERRRQRGQGITSYTWCGQDDRRLLVPLSGDLYLVELGDDAPRVRRLTQDPSEPKREPVCDAAGTHVAYVKQNDLHVQALDGSAPRRLTRTGSDTRSTGLAEFIAEEELGRHAGIWWSPDGRQLLAMEVDESPVQMRTRPEIGGDGTRLVAQRYPAAGTPNAKVRALRFELQGDASPVELPLPPEAEYVVRAGWFADGQAWLQWMTRDQRRTALVEYGPGAKPRTVLQEEDDAWVETHSEMREVPSQPRSGKPALLWPSERGGSRQYWLVDRVTGQWEALTRLPEPVGPVVCMAADRLLHLGATGRGRGQEVFETDFQGRSHVWQPGESRRWREAKGDKACQHLMVTTSSWTQPSRIELVPLAGAQPPQLLEAAQPLPELMAQVPSVQPVPLDLTAADGHTVLNGFYVPARGLPAGAKAPLVVRAYGGPTASSVNWRWPQDLPQLAFYQQQGYAQLILDVRGQSHRDRAFSRAHFRSFGRHEVADLFTAIRQTVALRPDVDGARVGFVGWSYGGFLAARAMLDADTPLAAAIAGAPPTDWTLYDTAYTERYLGLPDGGRAEAYAQSNLVNRAALLSKPLMLIHGTADDNVLFDHTLRLIQALQNEGKLFETAIYPGHAHSVAGRKARLHLARTQFDFFQRHLAPAQRPR